MPAQMSIAQMREMAEANLADAEARLVSLRQEKANIQAAIKATVAERDEAKRIAKKLAPPKPKPEPEIVDVADDEAVEDEAVA